MYFYQLTIVNQLLVQCVDTNTTNLDNTKISLICQKFVRTAKYWIYPEREYGIHIPSFNYMKIIQRAKFS